MMKLQRALQVSLTIFYGQLLSIGLYDNLIGGIPDLIKNTDSYFNITRVALGGFILISSTISLIVVWNKAFKLIFLSGIMLVIILLTFIIVNTIHLTQVFDTLSTIDKYQLITEIIVKSIIIALFIFLTFFMASRSSYHLIQNN